jgi:hypothetical protein
MQLQEIKNNIDEWCTVNEDCPRCKTYYNISRILFILILAAIALYLLYNVRHDIESDCCQKYKMIVEKINRENEYLFPTKIDNDENLFVNSSVIITAN